MPCWYTVSSITRGTRRSRVSFGNLSHLPKTGRPRPSRTTQVRGAGLCLRRRTGGLPSLVLRWSTLPCFGQLLFLRYISECCLWERIMILLGLAQSHPVLTCDILSTAGPLEVSYRPVLPTNLSVTGLPPLDWGRTPHARWFVFCILLFRPSSTSACAFSCTVLLLPCAWPVQIECSSFAGWVISSQRAQLWHAFLEPPRMLSKYLLPD